MVQFADYCGGSERPGAQEHLHVRLVPDRRGQVTGRGRLDHRRTSSLTSLYEKGRMPHLGVQERIGPIEARRLAKGIVEADQIVAD